ncbi:MAG: branched-chain amino acid ABC transporter permease, partial [Alphaproteobacteria bacterium]|nr:branched-chain amino acid ABC transporter permease [Alphaproteobacteria bacterium]
MPEPCRRRGRASEALTRRRKPIQRGFPQTDPKIGLRKPTLDRFSSPPAPMSLLFQTLLDGLVLGGVFSLAAAGFSLIFGVMNVVNLTHGVIVLIGAYLAWWAQHALGIDPLLAIPGIMVVLFGAGYAYQRTLIQSAVDRSSLLASLLVTFGVALVLRNLLVLVFGPDFKSVTPSYAFTSLKFAGLTIDLVRLAALGASLGLIALLAFVLYRTDWGRVIRATAQQDFAAGLCGV